MRAGVGSAQRQKRKAQAALPGDRRVLDATAYQVISKATIIESAKSKVYNHLTDLACRLRHLGGLL